MKTKILSEKDLLKLKDNTKTDLYYILLQIEEELDYNNKKVTNTIDYLQGIK